MKKLLAFLLSVLTALSLTACAGTESNSVSDAAGSEPPSSSAVSDGGKTLVAYFSATGSTKRVAEYIAKAVGGDLFEITPEDPYTDGDLNYNDKESRVSKEHDNVSERNVPLAKVTPDNFEEYDTVYIGYPIWWGVAAWPANSFVTENDFSGKTVIPFCTSANSGLGNSADELKQATKSGDWLDGKRFSSGVSENEVAKWAEEVIK